MSMDKVNYVTLVVDAGGSSTRFECFDSEGLPLLQVNSTVDYPTIKPSLIGYEHSARQLTDYIIDVFNKLTANTEKHQSSEKQYTLLKSIVIGSAGIYNDEEKLLYSSLIRNEVQSSLLHNCSTTNDIGIYVLSDVELALIGASNSLDEDAILLIAGTGSIVFARVAGTYYRAGGYGLPYSDEGSGEWIVTQMLRRIIQLADECGESHWFEYFLKTYSIDIQTHTRDFVMALHTSKISIPERKELHENLMMKLLDEYISQDPIAVSIINQCVQELVQLVQRLVLKISRSSGSDNLSNVPVYLHGSIATHRVIQELVAKQLQHLIGMRVVESKGDVFKAGWILSQKTQLTN